MSLAEYEELLADMIARDKLTLEQAQQLRTMFMNGDIREDDLPLPLEQAREKDDLSIALFGLPVFQTRQSLVRRENIRARTMRVFNDTMPIIASDIESTRTFHEEAARILQGAMFSNWMAGHGTSDTPNIDSMIDEQLTYLYRFAGEQSAMSLLGTPYSEEYTVNRLLLYGGAVWASWFYGNESVSYDDGYVIEYRAADDMRTCSNCRQAQGYYRIGTGPMPGQICYGGSRCRCERIVVYAPEILARL